MKRTINVRKGSTAVKPLNLAMSDMFSQGGFKSFTGVENLDTATDQFNALFAGTESLANGISPESSKLLSNLTNSQRFATISSIASMQNAFPTIDRRLADFAGTEGFSMAQFAGESAKVKGVNITLNALSHRQTDAAEALFTTVTIPYAEEYLEFSVRTAGLGRYIYGAAAGERASELVPVMSLIRKGKAFMADTLRMYPVYPTDSADPNRKYFMAESVAVATEATYDSADPLNRQAHKTQYLKVPVSVPNLVGLSEAPGQNPFETSDEVESNSIQMTNVALTANVGASGSATAVVLRMPTVNMSQAHFGIAAMGASSDDRQMDFQVQGLPASALFNIGNDTVTTALDALKANGAQPFFSLSITGTYQRQTNTLKIQGGSFELEYIKDAAGNKHLPTTSSATIKALFGLFNDGEIAGVELRYNHTNINRVNFGYRVEVFDARKTLTTHRQTPISVRYPVSKEDTNEESLSYAIDQMAIILNAQTTANAFTKAEEHVDYVTSINGSAIVGNEQASNVLAGMHYANAAAINRTLKLADIVSTQDSVGVVDNISAALCNTLSEMAAALATNSGLAAIAEYTREKLKWQVVAHQNMGRYLMRNGDARTMGAYTDFAVELTNVETMIGKFYLVPQSETDGNTIDPLGGMGVCVDKEHVVVQGDVTRTDRQFGILMTMPIFQHHSVCPIVGVLTVEDAVLALNDEGLIDALAKQRVVVNGVVQSEVDAVDDGQLP